MKKSSFAYLVCTLLIVSLTSFLCEGCMVVPAEHEKASIVTVDGNMVTAYGVETTTEGMITYYKTKEDKEADKNKVTIPKERVKSITDLKTE
jgi:hypothetical protein